MRGSVSLCGAAALLILASLAPAPGAAAEKILKREPPKGQLRSGQCVLVDDGGCAKDKIKRVCSGSGRNPDGSRSQKPTSSRIRTCIARPK